MAYYEIKDGVCVLPDSVTEIDNNAFEGCTGLASIVASDGNRVYDSRSNCNALVSGENFSGH